MTTKKTESAIPNKSEWIRQHANLSPKQIVARAKQKGVDLSINMVYTVRSAALKDKAVKELRDTGVLATVNGHTNGHTNGNGNGVTNVTNIANASPVEKGVSLDTSGLYRTMASVVVDVGADEAKRLVDRVAADIKATICR